MSRTPSTSSQSTNDTELSSHRDLDTKLSQSRSKFRRWRPSYHLQAPSGWMNDPCAPHYDHTTGLYHVSYQSNLDLNNADWGDIAWRSATSPDLVSWTPTHSLSLSPDANYDDKGVFTGCRLPSRDNSLTYAYTSVSDLPIHHTLPHVVGSESLSLARSFDGGRTWQKFAGNPILPSEPSGLDVTGWRDPFVSSWPEMAKVLGLDTNNTLFGIISGGIRDVTPTTFLYSIDANDLTRWQYIGPLVNFGMNLRPSRWSGDLGKNWEVTNFMTLQDTADSSVTRNFLVMGTEGCLPSAMGHQSKDLTGPSRPLRGQLWMSGSLKRSHPDTSPASSPVQMEFDFGGHLDHGCLYAANAFFDPKTGKHIVWAWITEEDLCDELRHEQGWSGLLSLPREIHLQTIENVVSARTSKLEAITSIETDRNQNGTHTVRTLATEPVTSMAKLLRRRASCRRARLSQPLPRRNSLNLAFTSDDVRTSAWELDCSFSVARSCQEIGLQIVHSRDFTQTTTLTFSPKHETFVIERPSFTSPSSTNLINTAPECAPHTLFTTVDPSKNNQQVEEPLHIQVWRDNSVLEVFVNGRTAVSTRIYAAEDTIGIRFFADDTPDFGGFDGTGISQLIYGTLWDGIGA
ncbi:putative beta-Fructufuranosidase [Aureobasidium namibiae CBS 147.97]|uniref:Putative beta-Fructufuranosidase n=1 Tax=Aureobasidium namibiae CBS 147.97 TaxID=1043004 RepID=A0A074WPX0_9PEZI|nr:putative beta-Fructufuranosidase [Aureobasidium namibiae CBS 147.97]KEQ75173.1 putative beta-Fructufuranosidase [Aureobasidium namibiae CBS 147.97]